MVGDTRPSEALVFGASTREAIALYGRATEERATSAFAAIGSAVGTELVAAPDFASELKLGVGPGWSAVWIAQPALALERHVLRAHTEVWGLRIVPGVVVSSRALASIGSSRAHRDFLRAPRASDRAIEAMRVAEHALSLARIEPRVLEAMKAAEDGAASVEELADRSRLTSRHLGRLFASTLGVSPKRALSLLRMRRALGLATGARPPSWAAIAAEAGYADQSHMGRAFRALLGASPEAFVQAVAKGGSEMGRL